MATRRPVQGSHLPPNTSTYVERAPLAGFAVVERAAVTDVGRGFDSVSGRLGRSDCVQIGELPSRGIRGARTSVDLMYLRNGYQLMDAVNVGAQASGLLDLLNLGGKASYAKSQSTVRDSEYLIIRIVVEGEKVAGRRFKLSSSARALLATNQRDKFYELCGDQFVAGYVPGIEFFVVAQVAFDSLTSEVKQSFGVSAGIPILLSVDIETARSTYLQVEKKVQNISIFAAGGDGTAGFKADIDALLADPTQFLPGAATSPAVLQLALENYTAVEGLPASASLLTHPMAREHLDSLIQRQRTAALQRLTADSFALHWAWWQGKLKIVDEECRLVDRGWFWSDWRTVCETTIKPKRLDGCQVAWLLDRRHEEARANHDSLDRQACARQTLRPSTQRCKQVRAALAGAPKQLQESALRCLGRPGTCRAELVGSERIHTPSISEYYAACRPSLTPGSFD